MKPATEARVSCPPQTAGDDLPPRLPALLGAPIAAVEELTAPWAVDTRSRLLVLADGRRVVLQTPGAVPPFPARRLPPPAASPRPRAAAGPPVAAGLATRARLAAALASAAPWLPVPAVLVDGSAEIRPFLVTAFVAGPTGRELLGDAAGARSVGTAMGRLARDLARVPQSATRGLPDAWARAASLRAAAEGWLAALPGRVPSAAEGRLRVILAILPDVLGDPPPVFAHGDLAPVNVIVRHGRVAAVLDLERARLAHPLFDAAWWRWIVRLHHPDRLAAAGPAFVTAAGLRDSADADRALDALALLQCLEALHLAIAGHATPDAWAERIEAIAAWTD